MNSGLGIESIYFNTLWTCLLLNCPFDTGNTIRNINFLMYPDKFVITIEAPTTSGYDYTKSVNYGLMAKKQKRERSVKEDRNFMWIERSIIQAQEILGLDGSENRYELFT